MSEATGAAIDHKDVNFFDPAIQEPAAAQLACSAEQPVRRRARSVPRAIVRWRLIDEGALRCAAQRRREVLRYAAKVAGAEGSVTALLPPVVALERLGEVFPR